MFSFQKGQGLGYAVALLRYAGGHSRSCFRPNLQPHVFTSQAPRHRPWSPQRLGAVGLSLWCGQTPSRITAILCQPQGIGVLEATIVTTAASLGSGGLLGPQAPRWRGLLRFLFLRQQGVPSFHNAASPLFSAPNSLTRNHPRTPPR